MKISMSYASTANGATSGATGLKVAVIGGGFTGVAFIIHAIRAAQPGVGLDFTIVEPAAQLGRGVAYGTDEPQHRINVPSDRMSIFAADPGHATRWLLAHGAIDAGSADARGHYYVSRARYGEYVAATLNEVVANAAPRVRVVHRRATATGLQKIGAGYVVQLADGTQLDADRVALCFGHTPSKPPGVIDAEVFDDDRFVAHPWSADALRAIAPDASVLLVGTGLTMADVAVTLLERGHRGRITAISRRGLRPRPHGVFADTGDFLGDAPAPRTARGLLRMLRERIATDELALGQGWHATADAFRFQLPTLWNALPPIEKRRVVARLLPFWDVHRFRIAPQIHDTVEKAIVDGQMTVVKARIADIHRSAKGFRAGLAIAGGGREERDFDAVVFCTGAARDIDRNPLARSLIESGIARLDVIGMGLDTDLLSRVRDASGNVTLGLFAFGPITRGSFGEMTGAPDITRHVENVLGDALLGA